MRLDIHVVLVTLSLVFHGQGTAAKTSRFTALHTHYCVFENRFATIQKGMDERIMGNPCVRSLHVYGRSVRDGLT